MTATEGTIELVAIFVLLTVGLSQVYAPRAWTAYYRWMEAAREPAVRLQGVIGLTAGGTVLWLHSVWTGAGILLTFIAGLLAAEGAMCLLAPRFALQKLALVDDAAKARTLFLTGVSLIVVAGVLAAHLFSSQPVA
jgi:uncharacterized protein YjeT (DUF2065 family)